MDKENTQPDISIIVPMYNEEENVADFYKRLKSTLNTINMSYEVICVDDGSSDKTLEKLLELRNIDENVKIINFSRNFGKEIALTAGIDYSIGSAVIPIDADLQDPPEVIIELINKWKEGYDMVYAVRKNRHEQESWLKQVMSNVFYKLSQKIMYINMPPHTGDFRLMDKSVVDSLKALRERNRFMKGLFAFVGFKQAQIEFESQPRNKGKTKWNYLKLFNFAIEGITSFSSVPLRLITYAGFFIALLSLAYASYIVVKTLIYGTHVSGYPSLITIILFLGAIQLVSVGVLGEYIGRIYNEVKQRPIYIIRREYGFDNNSNK
jgi:glycosyltransferase involved in cell wall biosynthesis